MFWSVSVRAAPIKVVASIQPLALITEAVAGDRVAVTTLLQPGQTPHDFAFKVSDRQRLEQADLLLWVGKELEPYLASLAGTRNQLSMASVTGLDSSPDHDSVDEGGEHVHAHGDQHLWLNPEHGAALMSALAQRLSVLDPPHAEEYQENARREGDKLRSLKKHVSAGASSQPRQYAVVHEAYQHFLEYFDYPQPLVLTPIPELSPGARQLWRVGEQLEAGDCLLVESASPRKWVNSFAQSQDLNVVNADIMGSSGNVSTYYELIEMLTITFDTCLTQH